MRLVLRRRSRNGQRGQSLVELAILMPVLLAMVGGVVEFGLAFSADLTVEAASREAARTAASLGNYGTQGKCPNALSEANVDPTILRTVQTGLQHAGIDMTGVTVKIFNSQPNGKPTGTGETNTYSWNGSAFVKQNGSWNACQRHDGTFAGGKYDQVGVEISYTYRSRTGLLSLFASGVPMTATAVFPIGPPWTIQ